ncbi:MAG: hypothetical protein JWR69_724 [Pedosphaera sp.]|nr:hypothetical protein [Pedosphaera sp.]
MDRRANQITVLGVVGDAELNTRESARDGTGNTPAAQLR